MKKEGAKKETREALITAFWKLYREKSIEKITVGEIAAAAGYNRSTFYEYFYDVPDVLQHIENGIVEDMQFGIPDDDRLPMDEVVATFERNADALSVLLGEHGDFSFFFLIRKRMRDAFAELAKKNGVPPHIRIADRDRIPRGGHHGVPADVAAHGGPPLRGDLSLRRAQRQRGGHRKAARKTARRKLAAPIYAASPRSLPM